MTYVNRAIDYFESADEVVREMALASFAGKLQNKKLRDRAAYCMRSFADERFIGMLINSLLSTDLVAPASPPGALNAGVGRDGGVGFSSGGGKPQERLNQHKDVLATLSQVTGQNFGFDIPSWRVWFAKTYAYENLDLRRDEY